MFSGSDEERVKIHDIEKLLDKAPSLKDKPKLIISQACRGSEYEKDKRTDIYREY